MAGILVLLLLALGMAQAQQSAADLHDAASKGNKVALQQLRNRAEQGDAGAQSHLGWMYVEGKGVHKDMVAAVNWFRKAAEQGDTEAQIGLGAAYNDGEGVPKDYVQAYMWLTLGVSGATSGEQTLVSKSLESLARKMTPEQIAESRAAAISKAPQRNRLDAPDSKTPLTNEMIIRMVQSGVPSDVITRTIAAADKAEFTFLPGDLDLITRYRVPDDVFKAMAAKSNGRPTPEFSQPNQAPAVAAQPATNTFSAPQTPTTPQPADVRPGKATLAAIVGAKLFIEPMEGFERYLEAAILSKKLPVTVVIERARADFVARGTWRELDGGFSGNGSLVRPLRTRKNYSASVSIVDLKSSAIVFSFAAQKSGSRDLSKEIAEEWATKILGELLPSRK